MATTPIKHQDLCLLHNLTPVRFLDSPKTKHTPSDCNVAACKSRLETIMKTIDDNFNKWQLADKRGMALCSSIETIKSKVMESLSTNENLGFTSYPDDLGIYCDKLAIITSIFQDITKNAKKALRQLKALSKLPGSCNKILYRSWRLNEFISFLEELLGRYERETKVKEYVTEHLPHCTTKSDLIRCTAAWEYSQNVDSYVKLLFLFYKEEIKK